MLGVRGNVTASPQPVPMPASRTTSTSTSTSKTGIGTRHVLLCFWDYRIRNTTFQHALGRQWVSVPSLTKGSSLGRFHPPCPSCLTLKENIRTSENRSPRERRRRKRKRRNVTDLTDSNTHHVWHFAVLDQNQNNALFFFFLFPILFLLGYFVFRFRLSCLATPLNLTVRGVSPLTWQLSITSQQDVCLFIWCRDP